MSARKFYGSVFAVLIALVLAPRMPASAQEIATSQYWTVAEVAGSVIARNGMNPWNEPERIAAGQKIGPYSTLEAGNDSQAILVRGGDRMTVYSNTQIELPGTDRSSGLTHILQRAGEALFRVRHRGERDFRVETPYLVAGVRGTTFGVTATDATSELHVVEGAVAVGQSAEPDGMTIVHALQRATAGLGMETSVSSASEGAVDAWDDRTLHQAAAVDDIARSGPMTVRTALRPIAPPTVAGRVMTDTEDLAARLVAREQAALERATADPTPMRRSIATMAQASNMRLSAAGLALDSAPSVSRQNSQAVTPVVTTAPVVRAPQPMAPAALPAQPTIVAPVREMPAPVEQTTGGPRSLLQHSPDLAPTDAETVITAPSGASSSDAATGEQASAAQSPAAQAEARRNADGVVYTTFGIQKEEAGTGAAAATEEEPLILPPDLNIEGLGAGD